MRSDFKNQELDLRLIGEESNSLRDLLSIFFRWKWHSIFIFFLVFVLSIVITMIMKEKYTSEAKVLVKPGRESIATDPSVASENSTIIQTISQNREDEVMSEMTVLTSYELIETIVDEMSPEVFLARPDEIEIEGGQVKSRMRSFRVGVRNMLDWLSGALVALDIKSELSSRSKAIKVIQKNLEVHSDGESNIISIAFRSQNPHLSQQALKRYMDLYQQHHVEVHQS
ncbi:MAG: Wzz/FepE/Etk N-terminal domain-containing protein, partial [Candidatus Hinthialibacter sp.]